MWFVGIGQTAGFEPGVGNLLQQLRDAGIGLLQDRVMGPLGLVEADAAQGLAQCGAVGV
jgi:hypothetical protein